MELKPGYKQTEVGVIPEDWRCLRISDVAVLESGHTPSRREPSYWKGGIIPWISLHDTENLDGRKIFDTAQKVTEKGLINSSARLLPQGTVVFSRTATVGKTTVMGCKMATSQDFANYIFGPQLHNHYLVYLFRSMGRVWKSLMAGSIHNTIYMPTFKVVQIALPSISEQCAIAEALGDVDALLSALDRLLVKKRDLKQTVMQQLLTGLIRLPGFSDKWQEKQIANIASVKSEKNVTAELLPVLTCSKHFGFVDSLGFFKNQVFSKDLSTYKLIRRGEIGYPANHIKEGSIGLQDRYDLAVVSPIYVIFALDTNINSIFLHRLLKLDSYRLKFKTATSSSVDRRGSLRWPDFFQD